MSARGYPDWLSGVAESTPERYAVSATRAADGTATANVVVVAPGFRFRVLAWTLSLAALVNSGAAIAKKDCVCGFGFALAVGDGAQRIAGARVKLAPPASNASQYALQGDMAHAPGSGILGADGEDLVLAITWTDLGGGAGATENGTADVVVYGVTEAA